MKKVFIINGSPTSGKTTFAKLLAKKKKVMIHSSIDYVKEIATEYFDWDGIKSEESRKFLSDMKHFLIEETDIIELDLKRKYEEFGYSDAEALVIDIREASEIEKYKNEFQATTVLIENPLIGQHLFNKSDTQVYKTVYDYTILNDGTLNDLEKSVDNFIKDVFKKNESIDLYLRKQNKDYFVQRIQHIQEVFPFIRIWLDDHSYEGLYVRQWINSKDEMIFDFGSHSEFFVIKDIEGLFS